MKLEKALAIIMTVDVLSVILVGCKHAAKPGPLGRSGNSLYDICYPDHENNVAEAGGAGSARSLLMAWIRRVLQ